MQLAIDISAETPAALRLAATFLMDHANLREAMDAGAGIPPPRGPVADVPAGDVPAGTLTPPPPPPPSGPPHLSIVPPPPAPSVPPAPLPSAPVLPLPTAGVGAGADFSSIANAMQGNGAAAQVEEFDSAGVPFDIRIHQKSRNKKKDNTWKLQKGINPAIVTQVMQELAPRIRGQATLTPPAVGASAPVSLPPAGATAQPPQAPPAPGAAPPPPPPPAAEGQAPITTPGAQGAGVDPFRSLITKITQARNAGRISPEEITQCYAAAGAPSLQTLNAMPHLIPQVDASIDAILATR